MSNINLKQFLDGRSLFKEIDDVEPFPFLVGNVETLDTMLNVMYGSKTVFVPMVDCSLSVIAKMIVVKHGSGWRDLMDAELLKTGLGVTREVTELIEDTEVRTNERTETKQVSGFNSPVMVDNDATVSAGGDDLAGNKTRTLTDTVKDGERIFKMLSMSSKHSIVEAVLKDVNSFLTLNIY